MTKYHINDKGVAGVCRAQSPESCHFGKDAPHYATREEAEKAYEQSRGSQTLTLKKSANPTNNREPILREPLKPLSLLTRGSKILEATDAELLDYYGGEITEITSVDVDHAVEILLNKPREDWPDDLREMVDKNRETWGDPNIWEYDDVDYYATHDELETPFILQKGLEDWYYNQPNATDTSGALEHVREKGYETKGLRPAEAVKKMLREENGMILKRVERTSSVASYPEVPIQKLRMVKKHYDAVEPREPLAKSSNSSQIDGILQWAPNGYRVLDGYHRIKWLKENGKDKGNFLVLQ